MGSVEKDTVTFEVRKVTEEPGATGPIGQGLSLFSAREGEQRQGWVELWWTL